jgi:2-oxoglutarate ferredoxin oxidoreductase subunit beta
MKKYTKDDWYRQDRLPHIFCTGCGNGTIINCVVDAVDHLELDIDKTTFLSGIGCSSRAPGYLSTDSLHTTHGRALAFATGVKLAKPEHDVIVFTGDGDLAAIGGNHFIHACRRNINITVVCMNNQIYGMTGGQGSPCTPLGKFSSTTPYGSKETPFDLCELAVAAGANYVARWTSYHVKELRSAVIAGIQTPGFSFIEVFTQCPTSFGNRNKIRQATDQMALLRKNAVFVHKAKEMEKIGKPISPDAYIVGEYVRRARPVLGFIPKKQEAQHEN